MIEGIYKSARFDKDHTLYIVHGAEPFQDVDALILSRETNHFYKNCRVYLKEFGSILLSLDNEDNEDN